MARLPLILVALICLIPRLCHSFSPKFPTGRRILVLVDDLAVKSSHSLYFSSLSSRGYEFDFKLADDPELALQRYGQYLYDGPVLSCPTVKRKKQCSCIDLWLIGLFKSEVQKARRSTEHKKSGNEQVLTEINKWVFHEKGHLKAVNVRHHKVGEEDEPAVYRIKDDLEYFVEIY